MRLEKINEIRKFSDTARINVGDRVNIGSFSDVVFANAKDTSKIIVIYSENKFFDNDNLMEVISEINCEVMQYGDIHPNAYSCTNYVIKHTKDDSANGVVMNKRIFNKYKSILENKK